MHRHCYLGFRAETPISFCFLRGFDCIETTATKTIVLNLPVLIIKDIKIDIKVFTFQNKPIMNALGLEYLDIQEQALYTDV